MVTLRRGQKVISWIRKNKRTNIFVVCFLLSFCFWLLIKLSYGYNSRVSLEVDYRKIPEGKLLADFPVNTIEADIKAPGFTLLRAWINPFGTVHINVSELNTVEKQGVEWAYWATNRQSQMLRRQLPGGVEVQRVYPDTLFFALSKLVEKKVAVEAMEDLKFKKQFRKRGLTRLIPDSIIITGPESVIDTIRKIYTFPLKLQGIDETIAQKVKLNNPYMENQVQFSASEVELKIEVDQMTEAEVEVEIVPQNVPENYEMKVFPGKTKISYLVALKDFKQVKASNFSATVLFPDTKSEVSPVLDVQSRVVSGNVSIIRIKPETVEYIIRKK